ncbi:MAG: hypothetical protein KGI84_04955 [Elusimicrobia bacterium]|nr:hypothetical protein [Elusimicrobiota bacterium]
MPPNLKELLSGTPSTAGSPLGFHVTTGLILKSGISLMLSVVGFYFLAYGKKNQEPEKMLWGAALILVSFLIF